MKTCPKCNTQYADDTLSFCLNDGTPLTGAPTDTPTVVFNESETVVRGSGANWQQSQATHYIPQQQNPPQQPPTSGGKSSMLIVAIAALALLAVVGVAAVGGFIYFNSSGNNAGLTNSNNSATPIRTPETNKPSPTATTTPTPSPAISSPTPSASGTPGSSTSIDKAPTNFTSKRFEFPKGAFSSNISDSLDVGEQRTYLVACRAGQTMNTKVERGLPCVTYSNGGSALRWTTFSGDNKVTIKNNCDQKTGFVVSVSVM